MLARLVHRGPDAEGSAALGPLAFGMRRLSILDPTTRGNQPMRSADGRYCIVHNGEIYNFLELASELTSLGYAFQTETDTEVILAAYAQWGRECVTRFNGIWAFALWDAAEKRLLLSRDRFGVKPLFLTRRGGQLAFASEIKALLAVPWVQADPEPSAIHEFLLDGLVDHGDETFFRGIGRVPAAHSVIVSDTGERLSRYWGPPELSHDASVRPDERDERLVAELRELLVDAVALQLRADVPLGSCLSGGIDSSAIVSIASALRTGDLRPTWSTRRDRDAQPQLAFFAEFREEGIDERPYVDAVVSHSGVSLLTTTPGSASVLATLDDIVRAQDEPFGSSSIVAQYFVMQSAQESGIKVLLDGQGADELLGGYPPYRAMRSAGALLSGEPLSIREAARALIAGTIPRIPTVGHLVLGGRALPQRLRRHRMPSSWLGPAVRTVSGVRSPYDPVRGTPLAQNLWRQIASETLPSLLRFEDRNSMAFGVEARVPFLDHRFVEASLKLPDRLKIGGSEQKIALRRAMTGLVPRPILDRRDKVAFRTPQRRWLLEAMPKLRAFAAESKSEATGLVARGAFATALEGMVRPGASDAFVWRLLILEQWLRTIDGPSKASDAR